MEYFMQKYPYIYTIQWIIATLYASGMYSTLGEEIAWKQFLYLSLVTIGSVYVNP